MYVHCARDVEDRAGTRPAPPDVEAHNESLPRVTIERASGVKCERCWRYVPAVSTDPEWAGLCDRCQDALSSERELRSTARKARGLDAAAGEG